MARWRKLVGLTSSEFAFQFGPLRNIQNIFRNRSARNWIRTSLVESLSSRLNGNRSTKQKSSLLYSFYYEPNFNYVGLIEKNGRFLQTSDSKTLSHRWDCHGKLSVKPSYFINFKVIFSQSSHFDTCFHAHSSRPWRPPSDRKNAALRCDLNLAALNLVGEFGQTRWMHMNTHCVLHGLSEAVQLNH